MRATTVRGGDAPLADSIRAGGADTRAESRSAAQVPATGSAAQRRAAVSGRGATPEMVGGMG